MPVIPVLIAMGKNDEFKGLKIPSKLSELGIELVFVAYEEAMSQTTEVRTEVLEAEAFTALWSNEEKGCIEAMAEIGLFLPEMLPKDMKAAGRICVEGLSEWELPSDLEAAPEGTVPITGSGKTPNGKSKKGKKGKKKPGFVSTSTTTTYAATTTGGTYARKLGACLP